MSNIHDHRIDITGQDWSGAFRADGDYIAWRHVEPILEANKAMLEALGRLLWSCEHLRTVEGVLHGIDFDIAIQKAEFAIAKAKGATP